MNNETLLRCEWASADPLYIGYHDEEWSVPCHDDGKLFEMLSLEGAQAGLSWITILKRRDTYKQAFAHFDPLVISLYDETKIASLLNDKGIIRNEQKIRSVVKNARAFLRVQEEYGSFATYIWRFVNGEPKINCFNTLADIPASTVESAAMSKDLKKRGFSFVGATICYAFMQACGLVNDHTARCYKFPCRVK